MPSEIVRLQLEGGDVILMKRPESPALVHGRIALDAHPALGPLWEAEKGAKGTARVERRDGRLICIAALTEPVVLDVEVILDLPDHMAAGLERRPWALVMMYADDEARAAGLADFRTGGARGHWTSLGVVLPFASTDPLRVPEGSR